MFKRLLIANDGSEGAAKAFDAAIVLARQFHSELHMISVEELPRLPASVGEVIEEKREASHRFAKVVAAARTQAKARRVKLNVHIVAGHPVPSIVEFVQRNAMDLLVIGFMGHSAIYNRLIGSTTDRLVELAPCPVFVVK
jgi:nucleotide-binding universal stress UspA family protein